MSCPSATIASVSPIQTASGAWATRGSRTAVRPTEAARRSMTARVNANCSGASPDSTPKSSSTPTSKTGAAFQASFTVVQQMRAVSTSPCPKDLKKRKFHMLPLSVSALDQVDGIERAVDRVMSPEEEAGKRHHLAAAIGRQRSNTPSYGHIEDNPVPPTPGDEKKERNEHHGAPPHPRPPPPMYIRPHPLAQRPEADDVQSRLQERSTCHLTD